ncbi:hypothetical protein BC829DRAFT_429676 [Chytridium lagenaria]|nr:hypothetical protein BC829DRAFT_429676 [Chytridium lagenaria]
MARAPLDKDFFDQNHSILTKRLERFWPHIEREFLWQDFLDNQVHLFADVEKIRNNLRCEPPSRDINDALQQPNSMIDTTEMQRIQSVFSGKLLSDLGSRSAFKGNMEQYDVTYQMDIDHDQLRRAALFYEFATQICPILSIAALKKIDTITRGPLASGVDISLLRDAWCRSLSTPKLPILPRLGIFAHSCFPIDDFLFKKQ